MRLGTLEVTVQPALFRVRGPLFGMEAAVTLDELEALVKELSRNVVTWRRSLVPDHYQILGVPRDADADTIKKAYRRLSKAHHPDTGSADHTRMQNINEAYALLGDPQQRQQYDATR